MSFKPKPYAVYVEYANGKYIRRMATGNTLEECREAVRKERSRDKTFNGLVYPDLTPRKYLILVADWELLETVSD